MVIVKHNHTRLICTFYTQTPSTYFMPFAYSKKSICSWCEDGIIHTKDVFILNLATNEKLNYEKGIEKYF